ncbi:hypothetical protein [Actinomycetospora chiangmaiensis]|uniref:hypothetical protein n=1 Tax=Actinomycetospora chiangmaiensis TaxID=402650 RepID=UPI000361F53C|nr:hypothetical protein [Actinomycetospora chiangmaiensis]
MKRPDPGDWREFPVPRRPRAPWLVIARHGALLELTVVATALGVSTWIASDSLWRLVVVAILALGLCSAEVREMVWGQFRRIRDTRRLQAAFLELGICSRRRRLTPSVLGSAAFPGATVVRVWLPVGLTVDDIAARRHDLAAVCFVDTIVVERRPGVRNTIEVVMIHRQLGRRT